MTIVLGDLVKGFFGTAGGDLWGWVIGGGQSSAGTTAILQDLGNIETTLTEIDNELAVIEDELQQLACEFGSTVIQADGATAIDTWYEQYTDFLTDMIPANPGDPVVPIPVSILQSWATNVLNGDASNQSALSALTQLHELATAGAGNSGSIAACLQAAGTSNLYETNMIYDRPYYNTHVAPLQAWFLTYNTRAMVIITEAYHFNTWVAQGQPTSSTATDIPTNICPQSGAPTFNCAQPVSIYSNQFLPLTKDEFMAGGAPYSTDDFLLQIGDNTLFASSLENYNTAAGNPDDCASPQSSADSCGVTVGLYDAPALESRQYGIYGYGSANYGTWEQATSDQFLPLFNTGWNGAGTSNRVAGDYLCTMSLTDGNTGFNNGTQPSNSTDNPAANGGQGIFVGNKIVVFDETTPVGNFNTASFIEENLAFLSPAICFFDGNVPPLISGFPLIFPLCGGTRTSYQFLSGANTCRPQGTNELNTSTFALPSLVNGTYGSLPAWYYYNDYACSSDQTPEPQYTLTNSTPNTPQFRWPVLDITALACTDTSLTPETVMNPVGALSLCGDDFNIWFNNQAPPLPTTATTLSAVATPQPNPGAAPQSRKHSSGNNIKSLVLWARFEHLPEGEDIDLSEARLTIERVLNEEGELVHMQNTLFQGIPTTLTRSDNATPSSADFTGTFGQTRVKAWLWSRNQGELGLLLTLHNALINRPSLCDDGQRVPGKSATSIETRLRLEFAGQAPLVLSVPASWVCKTNESGEIVQLTARL